jgi:ABC-type arginine transport system permease subunit
MTRPSPEAEAAAVLRGVLDAVHRGELEADGREALGLLRRMEGAAAALEASSANQKR